VRTGRSDEQAGAPFANFLDSISAARGQPRPAAFGELKPLEVIERGEIDRLWNMIFYLESGVAG
jgi:hypothetical protein